MKGRTIRASIFFTAALMLAVQTFPADAQDKSKEPQKPPGGTVDAWRQALPPETETDGTTPEAASAIERRKEAREAAEKMLVALERKWMGALQQRDASVLSQLVSDDFTLVSPRLVVNTGDRDKYFQHATRDLNLTSYDFEGLAVRVYGRTAVVSGRLKQSASAGGEDWSGTSLFTDVWVNRDGIWQVVSRHMSPSPAEKR